MIRSRTLSHHFVGAVVRVVAGLENRVGFAVVVEKTLQNY
jgi:hypothetical protein